MHRSRRQSLFNAVAGGLVFQRRHGNDMDALRQGVVPPRDVIPAARDQYRSHRQRNCNPSPHGTNFSASFTAFHAGNRILSAAPQNHQLCGCSGLASGLATWITVSPAAVILLGPASASSKIANPPRTQALVILSASVDKPNFAQAENVTP